MSTIGSRETLHLTALGKAILTIMDGAEVRDLLGPGPLAAKTDNTITDVDELEVTAERGYAIDDEENILGLRYVSTPVVLDNGSVLGSISVSGPSSRMTTERIEGELEETLERAANVVQINTKFS
jgi:DNA-binding IclR family transcriptional regulator